MPKSPSSFLFATSLSTGLLLAIGCSSGTSEPSFPEVESVAVSQTESLRLWLEDIAETGQPGSGISGMESAVEGLKTEGVTDTTALQQDAQKMQANMNNPAEVKRIAADMLTKLPPKK